MSAFFTQYRRERQTRLIVASVLLTVAGGTTTVNGQENDQAGKSGALYLTDLMKCANGVSGSVSGELLGSINGIFNGTQTSAQEFKFSSVGDFLHLIPENDRLEAYRLYVGCLANHH